MRTAPLVAGWGRRFPRALAGPFVSSPTPSGRSPVDFGPGQLLRINVFFALGADLAADPSTWTWTRIPGDLVRYDAGNGITVTTGRSDASSRVNPGSASFMVDNRDGRFTRDNPNGLYYPYLTRNTPVLVQVDAGNGAYDLVQMFVNEFPNRWEKTQTDFWMPLRCGGVLRRINRGKGPLKSALRRGLEAGTTASEGPPLAYWPMEDASGAANFPSPISGIAPMTWYANDAVAPGTADMTMLGGSEPLPVLTTNAYLAGAVNMSSSATEWTVQFVAKIQFTSAATTELIRWETPGGSPWIWRLNLVNSSPVVLRLEGLDSDGTAIAAFNLQTSFYDASLVDGIGRWAMITVSARQSGGNILYSFVYSFGEDVAALGSTEATDAGTMKGISSVKIGGSGLGSSLTGTSIGHVLVRDNSWGYFALEDDALMGVRAETAVERLTRVCAEQGIPITFANGVIPSVAMGHQSVSSFADVLRECEDADGGVLYEKGWGLYYQPVAARYNRAADLVLNFSSGHISGEPEPNDDDQGYRNNVTVTRTGAESMTATDQDSVDTEGLYEDSATVNVSTPTLASQWADWRLHMGQDKGQRWPRLDLRFDNLAGRTLIQDWEATPPGARVTIANPPSQVALETIDVFIEGRTEKVNQFEWTTTLNASAAAPYKVFVLDDPVLGKLDTDGSVLTAGSYSAKSEGASSTKDYILVADFAAAAFNIGDKARLFTETGELKEATVFTVTSKPSGFGFTEIHFTPDAADYTYGLYLGAGETIRHASETSFTVTTASGYLWTTAAAQFPFNIMVGGERMTVTAISGASNPQTFTVTRSVNGVVKSHAAGAEVRGDFAVLAK